MNTANPSTVSDILGHFKQDILKRTTRIKEVYYYKSTENDTCKLSLNTNEQYLKISMFSYAENNTKKKEELHFHYADDILIKRYVQGQVWDNPYKVLKYPVLRNEDEHFMQLTVQDKFFPSFEDMTTLLDLLQYIQYDVKQWNKEMLDNKFRRYNERLALYRAKYKNSWKFSKNK